MDARVGQQSWQIRAKALDVDVDVNVNVNVKVNAIAFALVYVDDDARCSADWPRPRLVGSNCLQRSMLD